MQKVFRSILICGIGLLTAKKGTAQEMPQVYPNVQNSEQQGASFGTEGFKLNDQSQWSDIVSRTPVEKFIQNSGDDLLPLTIKLQDEVEAYQDKQNIAQAEGGYDLTIDKKGVTLVARDSTGVFYGLQTLSQLLQTHRITPVEIHDFPTTQYRGVVEGFYGTPWSQKDRISQLRFYGRVKANTYIYGPKDDPYHSSPHWREPYPEDQAVNIKKLVKIADKNFVDFVWAIHPGQDIEWNKKDRNNVLDKFEHMYDLGVRSFALFFDDISGEGTDAHKQADLLNYLNEHFVEVKKDVKPLILTPTDYNESWADPKPDGYLSILGRELDPSIQIMWTGDNVMSDVTEATLDWVEKRIQRPALFWWNFPVSDYTRDHLLLGPSYGLDRNIGPEKLAGVLSNPMEHAEASKPAIFGVADYAWNTAAYQPEKAWEKSLKNLFPNTYLDYKLFAANNTDPGKNNYYRQAESTVIAPYIKRLKNGITHGAASDEDLKFITGYFAEISAAAEKIEEADESPALIKEVKPWLDNFSALGEQGMAQIENYETREKNERVYWKNMMANFKRTEEILQSEFEDKPELMPVTGTLVLKPFVDFLRNWNSQKLIEKITGADDLKNMTSGIGSINSEIPALKRAKLITGEGKEVKVSRIFEVFKIKPNQAFTIQLNAALKQAEIRAWYQSGSQQWMSIEVSEDGENWSQVSLEEKGTKIKGEVDKEFSFVRVSNKTEQAVSLRLSKFEIENTDENAQKHPFVTHDLNVFTAHQLQSGQYIEEKSSLDHAQKVIVLTNSAKAELKFKAKTKRNKWKKISGKHHGTYIEAKLPKNTKALRISSDQQVKIHEVLWK